VSVCSTTRPPTTWGYRPDTGVVMKVVNGDWKLER
jgi:hypothetical protein